MADFGTLSAATAPGLSVLVNDDTQDNRSTLFLEAIQAKAFNDRLSVDKLPDAIFTCSSVEAVQAAVKACREAKKRICVRCGGNNWYSSWLQGKGTVLIDVGDLKGVEFDDETKTVTAGVGCIGSDINDGIPSEWFFPGGHCPGVSIGGFILGGGYGLGFHKYGLASSFVVAMEVVLASGECKTVKLNDQDETAKALFSLVMGSYSLFPAIVTKYTFKLAPRAKCVLSAMFPFCLNDWKTVLGMARDIQHRGNDDDAASVETTMVLSYCPPPLAEASGESKMAGLSLIIYGDAEDHARALYNKYSQPILSTGSTLVPPAEPELISNPQDVIQIFAPFYPKKSRFLSEGILGDESLYALDDNAVATMLVADLWLSSPPPPPLSHTIIVPCHKKLQTWHNGRTCAMGFTPSLALLSYAAYDDPSQDDAMTALLKQAHSPLQQTAGLWLNLVEGNIRDGMTSGFTDSQLVQVKQIVALLDPDALFLRYGVLE